VIPLQDNSALTLTAPLAAESAASLRSGQTVLISGVLVAARDVAHKRLQEMAEKGQTWPFDPKGQVIYYVGPSPARPGRVVGAAGPTTAGRMDAMTGIMLEKGVLGFLGKGRRSEEVLKQFVAHKAVYLAAVGGAGAYYGHLIKEAKVLAWPELGPEALMLLQVADFPATVVFDSLGNDLYVSGPREYRLNLAE
jgi:fumarate hydratase subunit beta